MATAFKAVSASTVCHPHEPGPRRALHDGRVNHCHRCVPNLQAALLQLAAALGQKRRVKTVQHKQPAKPADEQHEVKAHRQCPLEFPVRQRMPLAEEENPDGQVDIAARCLDPRARPPPS